MVPARALFYAILVSLLVALIIGVMLLASSNQHQLVNHYDNQTRLLYNCQSGIELLMANKKDSLPPTIIDLYQEAKDSVLLIQKKWGVLDVGFVSSWLGRDSIERSFLIGKSPPDYALQLSEGTSPLQVCGDTKIIGTAYLPTEGVERGTINGKYYEHDEMIFGKVKLVENLNQDFLNSRFFYLENLSTQINSTETFSDTIIHSFGKPSKVLVADYWNTANWYLKDNIILVAQNKIVVSSDAILQDIILIAPVIEIQQGFAGSIQAFASDSLVVAQDVHLSYPSILGLLPNQNIQISPRLTINNNSLVEGAIIVPSFVYQEYEPIVTIEQQAQVKGQVWVNGQLQHKGTILGSVFCKNFLLQTASAVYENYLLDATIDRSNLSSNFLIPAIFNVDKPKAIIKRLE